MNRDDEQRDARAKGYMVVVAVCAAFWIGVFLVADYIAAVAL